MRTGLFRLLIVAVTAILTWKAWDYTTADRLVVLRELDNLYIEPAWIVPVIIAVAAVATIGIAIALMTWIVRGFRTAR
jgi:hypothetical protein